MHHAVDFCRLYFSESPFIPFKMTLVGTLSVGAFWRGGLLNTLPICHFTVYTKCVIKYPYDNFFH